MAFVGTQADYAGWNLEVQEFCVIHDAISDMESESDHVRRAGEAYFRTQ